MTTFQASWQESDVSPKCLFSYKELHLVGDISLNLTCCFDCSVFFQKKCLWLHCCNDDIDDNVFVKQQLCFTLNKCSVH